MKVRAAVSSYVYDITYIGSPLFFVGVCVVAPLLFGVWGQGPDPLFWRVFGVHHTVILFAIGAVSAFMILRMKVDRVLTLGGMAIVVALHEIPWWVCAEIKYGNLLTLIGLFGAYFLPLCLVVVIFYFGIIGAPWRFILAMVAFYAVWWIAGFPITEIWNTLAAPAGKTALYSVWWANGVEILSWAYALLAFTILEAPRLRVKQTKLN